VISPLKTGTSARASDKAANVANLKFFAVVQLPQEGDRSKIKGATGWPRPFKKIYSLYPEYQIQRGKLAIKKYFLFAVVP